VLALSDEARIPLGLTRLASTGSQQMRVTRAEAEENRRRVVVASGKLFREKGFDGIGVADLMKSVGLTQGGFYKQFASKENLAREACDQALVENIALWERGIESAAKGKALEQFARSYLSQQHRREPGKGCLLAALAPDAGRRSRRVKQVFGKAVEAYASFLLQMVEAEDEEQGRAVALATLSQMVGALALSRAVPDSALAEEILGSSINAITSEVAPRTKRRVGR
jgi:TetR/AcrR family transcriptional regulator, transcriptional repressor for nem operon